MVRSSHQRNVNAGASVESGLYRATSDFRVGAIRTADRKIRPVSIYRGESRGSSTARIQAHIALLSIGNMKV